ncbi:MAG: prepilin-type N-terminal cleavage/methylation domain-containing protein [Lachnospiraceae bacterium]|jgi:prepilin-type N-terminal cleavage/methylation domain-containing protein|nr:prepilin-type N-terminal cleavage/methylation domain-containing protein [Lachnospiraceae bacterium]
MGRAQVTRKLNNDKGFSLVELIIVVSILAIAAVPLMKSMGMAAKTNAKAQSIQNATSLGESIMEEMKSTPIDTLRADTDWTFTDNTSNYVLTRSGVTATQGEKFDVKVTIDKASYSGNTTPVANKADNVKSANTLLLPRIDEIDTLSQAVLSSEKELNKYDTEAKNYFNQKRAKYPTETATITSKTIDIVKKDVAYPTGVTVKATVTYIDDASNKYVRELYTGSFVPVLKDGSTTDYKPLDSNIYIFYKRNSDTTIIPADLVETINITDSSLYKNALAPEDKDSHRIYFIRQDKNDTTGPKIVINGNSFTYATMSGILDDNGKKDFGDVRFVTNLDRDNVSNDGHIYTEDARTRVYEITVELSKGSEVYSTLNSTVSASDTPTPTPTPTPGS